MGSDLARVSQAQRTLQLQLRRCIATAGMLSVAGVSRRISCIKNIASNKRQAATNLLTCDELTILKPAKFGVSLTLLLSG